MTGQGYKDLTDPAKAHATRAKETNRIVSRIA